MSDTRPLSNDELYDQKVAELKSAADKARLNKWALVDKLLECEDLLGERFSQAVEVTQLAPGTISNYLSTGRAWPPNLRHLDMPFDYHTALNRLGDDQKTAAMTMAKRAGWDREELRRRVAAWTAGDDLAFDHRHKATPPAKEPTAKPGNHAGVKSKDRSGEEGPSDISLAIVTPEQPGWPEWLNAVRARQKDIGTPQWFASDLEGTEPELLHDIATWFSIAANEYSMRHAREAAKAKKQHTDPAASSPLDPDGAVPPSSPAAAPSTSTHSSDPSEEEDDLEIPEFLRAENRPT